MLTLAIFPDKLHGAIKGARPIERKNALDMGMILSLEYMDID